MKRLLILLFVLAFASTLDAQRPNILIIISDDHAFQAISAYGGKLMQTPSIDRIANEGALFTKSYVTNSICAPSRAVILTGKYSHINGVKDNVSSSFNGAQDSFIKRLKTAGYQTSWIGKWHLETDPQGFDYWQVLPGQGSYYNPDFIMMDGSRKRVEGYVTNIIADLSESWLNSRDTTKPFCLIVGHKATHRTWIPDTSDMGRFDSIDFPLPENFYDSYEGREAASVQDMSIAKTMIMGYDLKMLSNDSKESTITRMNEAQRRKFDSYYKPIHEELKKSNLNGNALTEWKYQRYMRDYLSTAASMDRNIGKTLTYLDEHNLAQNTIVIYMSDQGFYLGEHGWFDKRFMYEESFRTPMVMRYPGVISPGTKIEELVLNADIAPTMLAAAGVTIPSDVQGRSLLPLLKKQAGAGRKSVYYHYYENGEHSVSPHFGIRTRRYKLIRFYNRVDGWELFDLTNDPSEMNNLYGRKEYYKLFRRLKTELAALIAQYEDKDAALIMNKADVLN